MNLSQVMFFTLMTGVHIGAMWRIMRALERIADNTAKRVRQEERSK